MNEFCTQSRSYLILSDGSGGSRTLKGLKSVAPFGMNFLRNNPKNKKKSKYSVNCKKERKEKKEKKTAVKAFQNIHHCLCCDHASFAAAETVHQVMCYRAMEEWGRKEPQTLIC